jgi:hypothetical protein
VIVSSWEAQTCVHAKANFRQPAIEFLRQPPDRNVAARSWVAAQ